MISLDDETCIECGICADQLPQYFELADGKVRVKPGAGDSPEAAKDAKAIDDAAADCPTGSIHNQAER
jgi:ferredoxin